MRRSVGFLFAITLAWTANATTLRGAGGGVISGTVTGTGLPDGADTVVFIEEAAAATPPSTPVEMDQRGYQFIPKVLPIVSGTTVRFLNNDQVGHNVFSPDYEKYDLGTWNQGQMKDYAFRACTKAPCVYAQLCKAHPQMDGYIVVLQNQYFAVTDKRGHYEIRNVPPGKYTVGIWHARRYQAASKMVTVGGDATSSLDFQLSRARLAPSVN
jgi:plastocyanin